MSLKLFNDCVNLKVGDCLEYKTINYHDLLYIKNPIDKYTNPEVKNFWYKFVITAFLKEDVIMKHWNGIHPVDENIITYVVKKDTEILIWMISRLGDVGITDNLINPVGYDSRIEIELLENFKIVKKH